MQVVLHYETGVRQPRQIEFLARSGVYSLNISANIKYFEGFSVMRRIVLTVNWSAAGRWQCS
jgi:hypothetical protein